MTALLFLVPSWWPLLCVLPLVSWAGFALSAAAARRRRRLLGEREDAICGRPRHVRARAACAVVSAVLAAVALLQPVWGDADGEPAGPDVMVCLDVSRSMAARDTMPARLAAAQQQLLELAAVGPGTRLGLVTFAGDARLAVPLAADLPSVATIAQAVVAGTSGRGGSDLGAAIDRGLSALRRAQSVRGSLVVLTDGEDFVGNGVAAAARAQDAGVPVHCIGFGSAGGSKIVVDGDGGESFLQDANGKDVVTRLEVDNLTAVAVAGGGRWLPHRGDRTLVSLHGSVLVPAAAAVAARDVRLAPAHRFQWPLLVALLLWMLRLALPERRR